MKSEWKFIHVRIQYCIVPGNLIKIRLANPLFYDNLYYMLLEEWINFTSLIFISLRAR